MQILENGVYTEISELAIPNTLLEYKVWKIEKLFQQCTAEIENGFVSESTGHIFPLNADYQNNMTQTGLSLALYPELNSIAFNTSDAGLAMFTREQFLVIFKEAKTHKEGLLMKYFGLKAGIEDINCDTIAKAEIINW